ncbi:MAG: HAD family hydrolase [Mycoplasmataceae bacterium]|nr:HAD family hydrolase [Mycoplasmataceae bacterium]
MNKLDIENVFIDLDGTALKNDKTISPKTLEIIENLKNININVFVATGRPPFMIKHELEQLKVNSNVICINGGLIIDWDNQKVINAELYNFDSSKKLRKYFIDNKIPYLIYTATDMLYDCDDNNIWINSLTKRINDSLPEHRWSLKKISETFVIEDNKIMKFLIPTHNINGSVISNFRKWAKIEMPLFTLLESQENILDIIPINSSKGNGVRFIGDLMSLNLNKTIVFGDAENDISMFEAVKYSVAMENAINELKKVATHITKSNNEDGIYHFIKDNIL